MSKKKRQAEISFIYDRLWEQKLTQVYRLLIPDHNINTISDNNLFAELLEQTAYENSSDLYQSVFGPTKGE
jgi:hypothetical protein